MQNTFGQSYRKETEQVQSGSIAAPVNDVSNKSVAKAQGTETVRSNFRSNSTPEMEQIDVKAQRTVAALLSVAGSLADVYAKEAHRKKIIEGQRLAGTAEGREAIDGMSSVFSSIFGPDTTQRAGQRKIVKDTTIALNGTLASDAAGIGLSMSEEEWNAHVDKTIAAQTDLYDDEEIKDQITNDFAGRLPAIQSGWMKASTAYRAEAAGTGYAKNLNSTFSQVSANLSSIDPHVVKDAQQAIIDISKRPEGMTNEAHKNKLVQAMEQQLKIGNIEVFQAFKATGGFSSLLQEDQNKLGSMESAYMAKNDATWLMEVNKLDTMTNAMQADGVTPLHDPADVLAQAEKLAGMNPEEWAKMGLGPTINKLMANATTWDAAIKKENAQVTEYVDQPLKLKREGTPEQIQKAMNVNLDEQLTAAATAERREKELELGDPRDDTPFTAKELDIQLRTNAGAYAEEWSRFGEPSERIGKFGDSLFYQIRNMEIGDPEDPAMATSIETLNELRKTDRALFMKQFPQNGEEMSMLFDLIDDQNMSPFQAVAMRTRLKANQAKMAAEGKTYPLTKDQEVQMVDQIDAGFEEFVNELPGNNWYSFDTVPSNAGEIKASMNRIYRQQFALTGDPEQSMKAAKYRVAQGGTQLGEVFVMDGAKSEKVTGYNPEKYLQGVSDDKDLNRMLSEKYALPADTDFVSQLTSASVSEDGRTFTGWLETEEGERPFAFDMPIKAEQMLMTNADRREELVYNVMRTGRDAVVEVAKFSIGLNNTGAAPLEDALSATTDVMTKLNTGSNPSANREAEIAHQNAVKKLEDADTEQERKDNTYHGKKAVAQVELAEGRPLTYIEKKIVEYEGFVNGNYKDTKGIDTSGVGQTGAYQDMSFDETVKAHVKRIKGPTRLPQYDSYPEYLQAELLSSEYRGDLGLSPTAMKLARAGKWEEAAVEFLDNDEYRNPETSSGIKARMRNTSIAMARYAANL